MESNVINPCPNALPGQSAHLLLTLINTLMASQCALKPDGRYPPDQSHTLRQGDEFDFIVVGSGSAGSVVARKLAENTNWNVLLLEAGDYPSGMTEIPGMVFSLQNTAEDWRYRMEPSDTACLGLKGNVCPCPRGKVLGGSSSINAMVYIRGNKKDHDTWAELGNPRWNYNSVERYYKEMEGAEAHLKTKEAYGRSGHLKLSSHTKDQPVRHTLADAYEELGLHEYQLEKPLGYMDCLLSISEGKRTNTAKAFLGNTKFPNLKIAVKAQVSKLLMEHGTKIVKGVEVRIKDKLLKLKASKEVILSAGTVNSAQILLNSGIGPEQHLRQLGIPVIHNLDVGHNYQDHMMFTGFFADMDGSAMHPVRPNQIVDEIYNYFMHSKGALATLEMSNFMTFLNTRNNSDYPNIQIMHSALNKNDGYLLQEVIRMFDFPDQVAETLLKHNQNSNSLFFLIILLNPKSAGRIELRSDDPFDSPKFHHNFFNDEDGSDIQTMLEGVRYAEQVLKTEAFKKHNPKLVYLDLPNCKGLENGSDEYWKCSIRNLASTVFHPVGTCKMGPKNDPTAVIDSRLKVHGVKGVRVIDGSIMPKITSCNTNSPIIMIGAKGADLVLDDWAEIRNEL